MLHNIIVKERSDGHVRDLWELVDKAASKELFRDETGVEKPFRFRTRSVMESDHGLSLSPSVWSHRM